MPKKGTDKCQYGHEDCFAYGCYKRCDALNDTYFKSGECPFYKNTFKRTHEHVMNVIKLRADGRDDLIYKYGQEGRQPRIWSDIQ